MKLHEVEINPSPKSCLFEIKIDGTLFEPTCGVLVQSPMESHLPYALVTIKIPANVHIQGRAGVVETEEETTPDKEPIKGGRE